MGRVNLPPGVPTAWPKLFPREAAITSFPYAYTSPGLINNGGHRLACCGQVQWSDRGTHNIAKAHFFVSNTGYVAPSGGTVLRVSLQNLTSNAPNPDGTVDQSYSYPANTFPTASASNSVTFGSVRSSVATGEELALVFDYTTYSAGALPLLIISTTATSYNAYTTKYTGSWDDLNNSTPCVMFESDDATPVFGTLTTALPSPANPYSATINSASNPAVIGIEFQLPFAFTLCGMWANLNTASGSSAYNIKLYDGAGNLLYTLKTFTGGRGSLNSPGQTNLVEHAWLPIDLSANTIYRMVFEVTSSGTNTISLNGIDVSADGMKCMPGGGSAYYCQMNTSNVWSTTTTRFMEMGLHLAGVELGGLFQPTINTRGGFQ